MVVNVLFNKFPEADLGHKRGILGGILLVKGLGGHLFYKINIICSHEKALSMYEKVL
jgi:hypothetical protein